MIKPVYGLRLALGTSRGVRTFAANMLAAFGLISATIQFVGQLYPLALAQPRTITLSALVLCTGWGLFRTYPRREVRREFRQPDMTVTVAVGDLFEQDAHIVIGFTDTFDTSMAGERVISSASLQGQLVHRRYGGDRLRLERDLSSGLRRMHPTSTESRSDKRLGKLNRYDVGSVAVIGEPQRKIFALAYSRMGNDLVAKATADDIWISLSRLWEAVYAHARESRVAMPLIGSGLARVDFLDHQNLLRMILLSYVSRARQGLVCRELRVLVAPRDLEKVDLLELASFLRTL